jgi:diamine N-acetyltransferase
MSLKIIKANQSHADAIAMIGKRSFSDAFSHLFKNQNDLLEYLGYTYRPEKIAKSIGKENNVFFLAIADGLPVGFAKIKKHSLNDEIESVSQMELQKIYVLAGYHGTGAGSALLNAVIDLARQLQPELIWLDTEITNDRAIRFYEKNGFRKYGKNYFRVGTQTFEYHVMTLPVAEMECVGC